MKQKIVVNCLLGCLLLADGLVGQESSPAAQEIYQGLEQSVGLMSDGRAQSYGLYIAGSKSKEFVYLLGLNNLSVGIETKMGLTFLDGKSKSLESEEFSTQDEIGIAIYKVKLSTNEMETITKHPGLEEGTEGSHWILGTPQQPQALRPVTIAPIAGDANRFEVSGDVPTDFHGMPIFDDQGRILAIIAGRGNGDAFRAISISLLLDEATKAFAAEKLDLFPVWKEVYPSQYVVEQVESSFAILETSKPGAGFFVGLDKENNGYILTANHVVVADEYEFTIYFEEFQDGDIIGQRMAETQDEALDLAVVKVANCPPVKPVTIQSVKSLETIEKVFAPQTITVASLGRPQRGDIFSISKFGYMVEITDKNLATDLTLESGDSGGPLFNENGELIGINLKTELPEEGGEQVSIANHSRTILKYLDTHLSDIDFAEKWGFLETPSWWSKNRSWIIPVGAASTAGVAAAILTGKQPDLPGIDEIGTPPTN